jgi:cytochrome b involved in lipid metabolism/glutamine amidotransferase PdxT
VTVTATAADNVGVAGVQFKLDGVNLSTEDTTSPYSVAWSTTGSTNGSHALTAIARDAAGNTKTSTTVTVTTNNAVVDTAAPSVPTGLAATVISSNQINLTWTPSTDNIGVTGYRVYRNGTQVGTPATASYSDTGLTGSTLYSYSVSAGDAAGNWSAQTGSVSGTTQVAPIVTFTAAQVATHNTQTNCYMIISAKVYNLTAFLGAHPGGIPVMLPYCGVDGTTAFTTKNRAGGSHSAYAYSLLPTYYIGDFTSGAGDTTAPTVSITVPASNATVSGTVTITASAADNVGVAGVQFRVDGVNVMTEVTSAPYTISWGSTGVANGAHTISAVARDAAGNTGTSANISVTTNNASVDTTAPTVPTGLTGTVISSAQINLSWTASTDNVGVAGYKVYRAGVQVGAPTVTTYSDTGLTAATAYSYTVAAVDAAGNTSAQSTAVSKTTAAVTYTAAQIATYNTQTNCWIIISNKIYSVSSFMSAHPGGTPVIVMYCGKDATTAFTTNGTNMHKHSTTATAMLPSYYVGDLAATPDTTAPTVTLTAPAAGATVTGTVAVSATASDNVGVIGVQFKLDGVNLSTEDLTSPYSISWVSTTATNGTHSLTAVARDAAGNTTTSAARTVTVTNAGGTTDTTAPTVSITAPTTGSTVSGAVTVTATAADNVGVAGVQFKLDGVNLSTEVTTAPYTISWTSSSATNGSHALTAVARDAAGNTTTSGTVTVTVNNVATDTTAPTVSITAPTTGSTVSGAVTVTATAADNVGVAGVQFKLDGVNLSTEVTTAPYTISWVSTTATNGSHALTAVARDAAGNTTTSATVTVTVNNVAGDTTAPTVSITSPANNATVSGTNVSLAATAADNVGVVGVQFKVNGANQGSEDLTSPYSKTWDTTQVANGTYTITAVARDAAGNTTTATAVTVTVNNDTTPPTTPANLTATVISATQINLSWSAATDNVGVTSYRLYRDGVRIVSQSGLTYSDSALTTGTTYSYTIYARDAAGNTSPASTAVTATTL